MFCCSFTRQFFIIPFLILLLLGQLSAKPTQRMCNAFAKFASRWNPLPETLPTWSRNNCEKIHPRPQGMTCSDIVQFVTDCDYGTIRATPDEEMDGSSNRAANQRYTQQYYGNRAEVLPKYTYYNRETAIDYGKHGNWYYPNYYLPTYLGWFDGRAESMQQLENDMKFAKGGHYPYQRADNMINIALQQTMLPTCLHDLMYCVKQQYNSPYSRRYSHRRQSHDTEQKK